MNDPTGIERARQWLEHADMTAMEVMFNEHPFVSDDAALIFIVSAALWKMNDRELAQACGITIEAANAINARLMAAALVPEARLRDEPDAESIRANAVTDGAFRPTR